ncbi:UNKNOWN [Stylonychia lemnae]|uniref:Uncharacterized protein n=1 Tax=Stylonychia lemnae TaxID=5949 RepID=A0A078APJ9_STYLE|nr:UNKNOWN [Stylonychia lemnae]|eukprot:CDW83876.1 UNKNOWN [Stylonychia lemnae]
MKILHQLNSNKSNQNVDRICDSSYLSKDQGVKVIFPTLKVIIPSYLNLSVLTLQIMIQEQESQRLISEKVVTLTRDISHRVYSNSPRSNTRDSSNNKSSTPSRKQVQINENHGQQIVDFLREVKNTDCGSKLDRLLQKPSFNIILVDFNSNDQLSQQYKLMRVPINLSFTLVDENYVQIMENTKSLTVNHLRQYKIVEQAQQIIIDFSIEIQAQFLDWNGNMSRKRIIQQPKTVNLTNEYIELNTQRNKQKYETFNNMRKEQSSQHEKALGVSSNQGRSTKEDSINSMTGRGGMQFNPQRLYREGNTIQVEDEGELKIDDKQSKLKEQSQLQIQQQYQDLNKVKSQGFLSLVDNIARRSNQQYLKAIQQITSQNSTPKNIMINQNMSMSQSMNNTLTFQNRSTMNFQSNQSQQNKISLRLDIHLMDDLQEQKDKVDPNFFNLKRDRMRRIIVKYVGANINKQAKGFIQYNHRYHHINTLDCLKIFKRMNRLKEKLTFMLEQSGKNGQKQKLSNKESEAQHLSIDEKAEIQMNRAHISDKMLNLETLQSPRLEKYRESSISSPRFSQSKQVSAGGSPRSRQSTKHLQIHMLSPQLLQLNLKKQSSSGGNSNSGAAGGLGGLIAEEHYKTEDQIIQDQYQVMRNEDFDEKYQRHVQFNYFFQVPRYKTLLDAQILLRDVQKELVQWKTNRNVKKALRNARDSKNSDMNQASHFNPGKTQREKRKLKIEQLSADDERLFLRQLDLNQSLMKSP